MFLWLADAVLASHFALVLFVVGGLPLIVVGNLVGWHWVNALWFRLVHLAAIVIVAAQAWLGVACPLTTLELWLRATTGVNTGLAYSDSFVSYWLHRLLFYSAPPWVFVLAYTVFGLLVIAAWFWFPPHAPCRRVSDQGKL